MMDKSESLPTDPSSLIQHLHLQARPGGVNTDVTLALRHAAKSERYVRNMGARVTRGETKLILVKYENSANNNEPNHNRRGRGKS